MFDIPFVMFISYIGVQFAFLGIAFAHSPKIPILIMVAGLMMFPMISLTDNVIIGYYEATEVNIIGDLLAESQSQQNTVGNMATGGVLRVGEHVTATSKIIGLAINGIEVDLKRSNCGACGGYVQIGIEGSTAGTFKKVFGTVQVSALTTSFQSFKVSLPDNLQYQLVADDRISIDIAQVTGSGAGNTIDVNYQNTDIYNGLNTKFQTATATVWGDLGTTDLKFNLYMLQSTIEKTQSPNLWAFTEWPKIMYGAYSTALMLIGVMVYYKEK